MPVRITIHGLAQTVVGYNDAIVDYPGANGVIFAVGPHADITVRPDAPRFKRLVVRLLAEATVTMSVENEKYMSCMAGRKHKSEMKD